MRETLGVLLVGACVLHGLALQLGCNREPTPTAAGSRAILTVSPQALALSSGVGLVIPAQAVRVSNTGQGALKWRVQAVSQPWLVVSPTSGTNDGTLSLQFSTGALPAGEHTASFAVEAAQQPTAPVNVRLVLGVPPTSEVCGDKVDNDGDGAVDEDCPPPATEICGDGKDNDGDGQIDENPPCVPPPDPSSCPAGAVTVAPGANIQAAIDGQGSGATICLRAGVHRITATVTPKAQQTLTGEPGAVLSGARPLTSFERSGSYWVATGQTQQSTPHGTCQSQTPRCNYAEDLYLDDVMLRHVATLAEVTPGRWHFDYGADRIYFADDPTGKRVETTVTRTAIGGTAAGVILAKLTIEKFANPAQSGAIQADRSDGWVIRDSTLRWNHGGALRLGHRMRVERNTVVSNGQIGILGVGDDVLVEGNEIARNNTAGYDSGWEAGGTKFVMTRRLIVRNNRSHHNDGPGLWTDIDNIDSLYEGNLVEDNVREGIYHEISYAAIIRNNTIRRNGVGAPKGWLFGAGILVSASQNVQVYGNTVESNVNGITCIQQPRGTGAYGPWITQHVDVHDNIVRSSGQTGCAQDIVGETAIFTSRNNRFTHNTYHLTISHPFAWMNGPRTEQEWVAYGQDTTGTFTR